MSNGFFIFRFYSDDDRDRVLLEGPWVVDDMVLALAPWMPEFRSSTAKLSTCVVWLRLHELLPSLWTCSALYLVFPRQVSLSILIATLSFLAKDVLLGWSSSLISPSLWFLAL